MVDAISNANRRTTDDHTSAGVAPVATSYVELDVDAIKTPFVSVDMPAKTTLFVDGISPSDVQQGQVGDCTLQASLASLARTLGGRRFLENNVRANVDSAGNVTSYTATLFKKNAAGAYTRAEVNVPSNRFASYGAVHAIDGTGVEVWPRVYEAAMLQINGGKPCDNMPDAMGLLTGRSAVDMSTSDVHLADKLDRGFQRGQVQVLSTTGKVTTDISDPKLKPAHAYTLSAITVCAVPQADGSFNVERLYVLRNPWGYAHPRALTLDEVKKYFSMYSEGDVP
jgi:hypothetical protein